MNINKLNMEVAQCASKDESRYHLNGVHFTKEYTEGTDGHTLARITYPVQYPVDEMPVMIKTDSKENIQEFIVPVKALKDIKFPKGKSTLPILNEVYVDVEATNKNGTARFISTDLQSTPVTEIRKIDADFPDSDKVWPNDEKAVFEICVDASYLKKMADIAMSMNDRVKPVKLTFYDQNSPIRFESSNRDTEQVFKGLLMPIKGDSRDFSKPSDPLEHYSDEDFSYHKCRFSKRSAKSIWKSAHHFRRLAKRLSERA